MKKAVLLILLQMLAVAGASAAGYQFRHMPPGMNLSSKLVNVFYQDDDGFIYIGTASGLDRYDGYSVRSYVRDDDDSTSIHDNYVEEILRAPDGQLWVRAGGSYSVFNPSTERFQKNMDGVYARMCLEAVPSFVTFGSDGSCWAAIDGIGLFRHRNGRTQRIDDPDGRLTRRRIYELTSAGTDRLLAIDESGRLTFVDTRSSRICGATSVPGGDSAGDHVYTAFVDRDGLVWVYSDYGLWLYNPDAGVWLDAPGGTPLPQGNIKCITQDHQGRIWIGFDHDGIAVLDRSGKYTRIASVTGDDRALASNTVTALMQDRSGTMWVGSRKNGVSTYNDAAFKFDFTSFPDVNCILPALDGTIWLGTDGSGLIAWNRATGEKRYVDVARAGKRPDAVVALTAGADGTLWGGTYNGGLLKIDPSGRLSRITTEGGLACDNVWGIRPMDDGTLLLATLGGGLQRFDPVTGRSTVFNSSNSPIGSDYVSSISQARDGLYYVGTSSGMAVYDAARNDLSPLAGNRRGTQRFDNDNINDVMCDSRGLVWVATRDGLNVYDPSADSIYSVNAGGLRRFVLGVAEDATHTVWVSAGSQLIGIGVSASADGNAWDFDIHAYDSSDGLQTCDFNQRSLCALPDGEMMVGGFYGVNSFRPDGLKFGTTEPHVYFTGLSLFNHPVRVGEERYGRVVLEERLSHQDAIKLDYSDNEFCIYFATDDYVNPEKTVYHYRLDGFSEEWRVLPAGVNNVAYTNLAPGRYTLHVKAVSGDGVASANVASLGIEIRPPFYATTGAKLLYAVLVLAAGFLAFVLVRRHERRLSRSRERLEAVRKQEELDQLKFRFFTNVSHELRTPLTLITAPLESLLKKPLDDDSREKLKIISGNADRLLNIVNQLLDFRKNEVTGLTLDSSRGDVVRFVRGVCEGFRSFSESKHIHLTFFSSVPSLMMDFDEDKMNKILMNLLGNAFKFTPENGRVDVSLGVVDGEFELRVADSGCGVSDEDKKRIFERFYQSDGGRSAGGGTGIGLSLVAEYVRLHGGTVAVADNAVRGAVFIVRMPISGESAGVEPAAAGAEAEAEPQQSAKPRLLVVDDNPDLLKFIAGELSGEYAVATAPDGARAMDEVPVFAPDVIVSDLMMPEMDGVELCRRLKSSQDTAAIPLLILTAKHDVAAKIEGLTLGADDYMTKPFNITELRLRLKKLLELRRLGARRALIDPEPESLDITSLDEKLIERAVRYIDDHMTRTDLSVEELAAELGMSRVHLYKRLKQITGKTPIEFIRLLRLKRSAQLLRESQLNISEIAYRCGFNNPKYFSRYFKEEFGVLPSVYQENEGK